MARAYGPDGAPRKPAEGFGRAGGEPYRVIRQRPIARLLVAVACLAGTLTIPGPASSATDPCSEGLCAGAASVDSTWHVGASAGQYASDGTSVGDHGVDPFHHQTRRTASYGIQGREFTRALVLRGKDGTRYAVVANDLYIPQDLVNRRVATLLQEYDATHRDAPTLITPENLTISVSHSHSSPYYSTPSWGVWAFQDVFDIRFFEHIARKMADAVIAASRDLMPVRVGAAAVPFTLLKKHSFGPARADDQSPAGYPRTDVDPDLTILRFDDVRDPAAPKPLARWVVWGDHPENLDGNDLLASEYVNTMYRIVDRELGGVTVFSQNDTGTSEAADNLNAHPAHLRQEFSHKEYAQVDRFARTLADAVEAANASVALGSEGKPLPAGIRVVPFGRDPVLRVKDLRFAPPGYRLFPTVSSCRMERTFQGNPGIPIAGLPDCDYSLDGRPIVDQLPVDPGVTYEALRQAGVPVPDNVPAPSYTGLQETVQVHLQAVRLGSIGITVCPCEQWADQSRNIKSRLDAVAGNLWYGWDWTANRTDPEWRPGVIYDGKPGHGPLTLNDWCLRDTKNTSAEDDDTWACKDPRNPGTARTSIPHGTFLRMKAQIYNDARGWDALENALRAESEPTDVNAIWGNFTHEELTPFAYDMVVTVGMSNDYWGYIASYREFQRGDHYRKALTGLGPHSMDFLATRLSRMAAELNGGPAVTLTPKDQAYAWDYVHQGARAQAIGAIAATALPLYEERLPGDGGMPRILTQPADITRFQAARVRWVGGSNYTDPVRVRVERCVANCQGAGSWEQFAGGVGEVQVKANYPQPEDMAAVADGTFEWIWDATFEAFASDISLPDASGVQRHATPEGTYRFVLEGCERQGLVQIQPIDDCGGWDESPLEYRLVSQPFRVGRWEGITVGDLRAESGGVSFAVGPAYPYPIATSNTERGPIDYPDTYASPFRFISGRNNGGGEDEDDVKEYGPGPEDDEVFCFHCSFRPWADTGAVASAVVTVSRADGSFERVAAIYEPATGRFTAPVTLGPGETARIEAGDVIDEFGNVNGAASPTLSV